MKELHLKSLDSTEFTIDDDIESKVMDLLAENQTLKSKYMCIIKKVDFQ